MCWLCSTEGVCQVGRVCPYFVEKIAVLGYLGLSGQRAPRPYRYLDHTIITGKLDSLSVPLYQRTPPVPRDNQAGTLGT